MDEKRLDTLFARYVEDLVVRGEPLDVDELAGGDPAVAAALRERVEALGRVQEFLEQRSRPLTGETLLHYRVQEKLATGGMGEVYRAEDLSLNRAVALKVLPAVLSLVPERRQRFEREARILAGLNHRNITTIHAIERADGVDFLVLELVPGKTLAEHIGERPLRFEEVVPVFREIAEALDAAHGKGVVHRDLKPANVMVTPDGQVKVLDFGLGKSLGERELVELRGSSSSSLESTAAGNVLGTAAYMSPEQARGEEVDRRADVWSFGCVLYEALSGKKPFAGKNLSETVAAILNREPDWSALPPETPGSILALLGKCLAKEPDRRLDKITDATAALEEALRTNKITASLPAAVTPFLGREEEVTEIHQRLRDPACRLLTLVGPGGIGKTRLAIEAARRLAEFFFDGVCFVSVSSLDSSAFLFAALGDGLRLTLKEAGDPRTLVLGHLKAREVLLVLDSFEVLAHEAEVLGEILATAPRVKCLVTSRVTLGVSGEWVWEVAGLPCPEEDSSGEVSASPAVRLFLESARRVRTAPLDDSLSEVVRLCRRVEGMPLAIELAAASLRERSCKEIASALDEGLDVLSSPVRLAGERNRSVRASFEHSWQLLSDEERALFARLSLFRGGFRREIAEEIAGATPAGLSALLRASFLRWDEATGRFSMHDLLRQFGEQKLREQPQSFESARSRFCHFLSRLLTAELERGRDLDALATLTEEMDNVRAAWTYALESRDVEILDQSRDGLWGLYDLRGRFREGEEIFRKAMEALEALRQPDSVDLSFLAVRLLLPHAWFLLRMGYLDRAHAQLNKAYQEIMAGHLQNRGELAMFVFITGMAKLVEGDFRGVRSLFEENFAGSEGENLSAGRGRIVVGFALLFSGAYDEVEVLGRAGLAWATRVGDERGAAQFLTLLGGAASARGDQTKARYFLHELLEKVRLLQDQVGYFFAYDFLGHTAFASGDYSDAVGLYEESVKSASRMAIRWCEAEGRAHVGHAFVALGGAEVAAEHFREALRLARDIHAAPVILDAVAGLALLSGPADLPGAERLLSRVSRHPGAKAFTKTRARDYAVQIQGPRPSETRSNPETKFSIAELETIVAAMSLDDHFQSRSSMGSLPLPTSPLVGREEELRSLDAFLRDPEGRLLTLMGPGGIGKTRLAIEIGGRARDRFRDGVCFATLASVWQPSDIDRAMANAVGLPVSAGDLRASLIAYLRDKEMLLVLDTFEHLIAGKGLVAEILKQAAAVKILVTSREPLALPGERLFEVSGLEFPDGNTEPERMDEYASVRFFDECARRIRPDFLLAENRLPVARICNLLGGRPLAIQLAAAWVRELDCFAIADALEEEHPT